MYGIQTKVTVKVADLLARLKANRERHAKIVAEAQVGYVKKAKETLYKRLQELTIGEIVTLSFDLRMPSDHTKEYDTIIGLLGMATEDVVVLTASEYRMYVEDVWDWESEFLVTNTAYSSTSEGLARTKGYI